MNADLDWHDEAEILGVRVRVHLFDAAEVGSRADDVARLLPIFDATPPRREGDDANRETFAVGGLCARPDAVFSHGGGLICLTLGDARPRDRDNWRALFRVDSMLQALAAAMTVAGQRQLTTAAMLREPGALYQFDPGSAVLEVLATQIRGARRYFNAPGDIGPAQLASFCEPRLRMTPGVREIAPPDAAVASR